MHKTVPTLVAILLCLSFPAIVIAQAPAASPQASPMASPVVDSGGLIASGEMLRTEASTRVLWGDDAGLLPGMNGFSPVSFIFTKEALTGSVGSVYVFIGIKNLSGASTFAPELSVELFQGEFGFGAQRIDPAKLWVEADGIAYYQTTNLYSNSIGNSDWDSLTINLAGPVVKQSAEGIRLADDRLYNDRNEPLPPTILATSLFDKDGVYIGSCAGGGTPETGARTPPGGSLGLSAPLDPNNDPICGFSEAGKFASVDLGVGGPYVAEYWVAFFLP